MVLIFLVIQVLVEVPRRDGVGIAGGRRRRQHKVQRDVARGSAGTVHGDMVNNTGSHHECHLAGQAGPAIVVACNIR